MAADGKKSAAEGVLGKRDVYQIGDPTITIAAAANFIADNAPAGTDWDTAYNSAYSGIKYARFIGNLPKTRGMDSMEFFTWAVVRDGWHYLKHIEGLSYSVNVMVAGVEATSQIGDGTVVVPISYSYIDLREAVVNLTREKEQSQRQTAKDLEEFSNFRDIAAKRSATAADNGRQGGRGKSK
jgi:hypothetical protein